MMEGWIKLYRKILDSDFWNTSEPFGTREAWIDLLLLANHSDKRILFNGEPYTIKRGQHLTSIRKLSERWKWSKERVARYLRTLEAEQMITKVRHRNGTLLTLVNYGKYQDWCDTNEDTNEDTHKDTNEDTNEDTNKDTDTPQTRMIKNDKRMKKNEKNEKNIYGEFRHVKLTSEELGKLNVDYGEEMAADAIRYLDEYIEMKGYKAQSHYLCIRKWVVDAVKRDKAKRNNSNKVADQLDEAYQMMSRWAEGG